MSERITESHTPEVRSVEPETGLIDLYERAREQKLFIRIFQPTRNSESFIAGVGMIEASEILGKDDPNLLTFDECVVITVPGRGETQREAVSHALENWATSADRH